jgi:2-keto-4-pentenoate hydratase
VTSHVEAVVSRLMEARNGGSRIDQDFIAKHPLTEPEALTVQAAVQAQIGAVGGWKIAGGSMPGALSLGPIPAVGVQASPATFDKGQFISRGIECEIAYRIGSDLMSPPYDLETALSAIDAVMAVIEIAETRLVAPKEAPYPWGLADHQLSGGLVYGEPVADWRGVDPLKQGVTLTFDGAVIVEVSAHKSAELASRVMNLANTIGSHCGGVKAGQIIITGSMSGNIPAEEGTAVKAQFTSFGTLSAEL